MAVCQRLHRESTRQPSSQIEPALRGSDIGDIPGPHLIGLRDRELAIERICRHRHPVIRLRRGAPLLHGLGSNPFGTHEPRDAVLTDPVPLLDQRVPDAGTAIGLAGFSVDHSGFRKPDTVVHRTASVRHMSRME